MKQVLVVEDSRTQQMMIKQRLKGRLGIDAVFAASMAEAKEKIRQHSFFVALVDLTLPDSTEGEVIDYVLGEKIPVIVLTAIFDKELRDKITAKPIMDYILKTGLEAIDYAASLVNRAKKNPSIKLLVVDDSKTLRHFLKKKLLVQGYQVFEASDGGEAIDFLNQNRDVRMVITDYNMPEMDGVELTKRIREDWSKEELSIIAISADEGDERAIEFLKFGANDYIVKPFTEELLNNRINHNIDMLEMMREIRRLSEVDYLTDLYNRRFFFNKAETIFKVCLGKKSPFTVAMMDIDHFKNINDTYGHASGDIVLKKIALLLQKSFSKLGIVARFGGEEFCVLLEAGKERANQELEKFRNEVEALVVKGELGEDISFTISIGLNAKPCSSIDDTINTADKLLYEAKTGGRNRIVCG